MLYFYSYVTLVEYFFTVLLNFLKTVNFFILNLFTIINNNYVHFFVRAAFQTRLRWFCCRSIVN